METAAAYSLTIPAHRRSTLEHGLIITEDIAEPVPQFEHNRQAPLVVLVCFEEGKITHIDDGKKGHYAGTKLVRLNMSSVAKLERPIPFDQLTDSVPPLVRAHVARILESGGILPPKSLSAVVDALIRLQPKRALVTTGVLNVVILSAPVIQLCQLGR